MYKIIDGYIIKGLIHSRVELYKIWNFSLEEKDVLKLILYYNYKIIFYYYIYCYWCIL